MKKFLSIALTLALTAALFADCSAAAGNGGPSAVPASGTVTADPLAGQTAPAEDAKAPKYVFLFIGDGMSFPQFQSAADYLGALADGRSQPGRQPGRGAGRTGAAELHGL